jgi:hypothetical protein
MAKRATKKATPAKADAAKPAGKLSDKIVIPRPDRRQMAVRVKGTTPLICNKFSEKMKEQIQQKKGQQPKQKKGKSDPQAEYRASMYELGRGRYGFKANAFKLAMIEACRFVDGLPMTIAKGAFHVLGDMVEIKGKPTMRTDTVRVPPKRGGADLRYRGEFKKWNVELSLVFDANVISGEQLANLCAAAGWHIGVGEQRPSAPMKPHNNGMWDVDAVVMKGAYKAA